MAFRPSSFLSCSEASRSGCFPPAFYCSAAQARQNRGMPDFRVHVVCAETSPALLHLSAEESHHLVVVNRAKSGDPVVAFDGHGREWACTLREARKQGAVLEVGTSTLKVGLPFKLTLAQSLPKGPCMDAIVRKATEIGASRVIPMLTERTQVRLEGDRQGRKTDKWQVAALEAAKQCGNAWLPEIAAVSTLDDVLLRERADLLLVASLHQGAKGLKRVIAERGDALGRSPSSAVWLVGPEGDFSPAEMERILAAGYAPVTLGPLVLRCETAAVYALSVLSHELGSHSAS